MGLMPWHGICRLRMRIRVWRRVRVRAWLTVSLRTFLVALTFCDIL
jgi:hypothetical protein